MDTGRVLAGLLALEAILGATGMVVASGNARGPFGTGMTIGGYLAVLVLCALAAWMEMRHERRAEGLALVALAVAWVMALIGGLQSQWLLAPAMAVVAFAAAFALVERFIERDEAVQAAH